MTGAVLRGGFGSETSTTSTTSKAEVVEVVTDDDYSNREKDQDQGFRDVSSILPYSTSFFDQELSEATTFAHKIDDLVYT